MQKVDRVTVKALELTAPGACKADFQALYGKVRSGQIFGAFHNIPSALAAVFLSSSIRHPERERVAASVRAFWLVLELGERIERLGLAV